jgi:hypothetical protein
VVNANGSKQFVQLSDLRVATEYVWYCRCAHWLLCYHDVPQIV